PQGACGLPTADVGLPHRRRGPENQAQDGADKIQQQREREHQHERGDAGAAGLPAAPTSGGIAPR
ncbi:MAG: hypothetical protein OEV33_02090, partial [Armatimonadota bacterium]|nr:hypothetical protein [Armatimonadota bacterium]